MNRHQISTSNKRTKRPLLYLVTGIAAAVLVLGICEYTGLTHFIRQEAAPAQSNGPTPEQQKDQAQAEADEKKQAIEEPTPTTQTDSTTVNNTALKLTTKQESNGTVTVFTNLGTIPDGTCTLTSTNGATTDTQTAQVLYQDQYSICAGFSVPVSKLGSGTWSLRLDVASKGTTVSQSASVEVK